jgi:hypothetical protein
MFLVLLLIEIFFSKRKMKVKEDSRFERQTFRDNAFNPWDAA